MSNTVIFLTLSLLLAPLSNGLFYLEAEIKYPNVCGYFKNHSLLLLTCPMTRSAAVPATVRVEPNVTLSPPPGTTLILGNVTRVTVSPPQVTTVPVEITRCGLSGLGLLPAVSESSQLLLNLSDVGLRLGDEGEFTGIDRVVWLDLSNNRIASVPDDAFDGLSELLVLDLSHNLIDHLNGTTFCGLSSLRALDIRENPMLMTFALLHLPSLESLDTSMTVLEIGTFCRMNSLKRVVLHKPLSQLQCFVFDSLPSLRELNYSYYAGSNQICFTMMCDPHPVLNKRVPFNFTITQLNSDGSVLKVARNPLIRSFSSMYAFYRTCTKNYENYLKHHDNNMPLTTGCVTPEDKFPACQTGKSRTCNRIPLAIAKQFSSVTSTATSTPTVGFTTTASSSESAAPSLSDVFSEPIQTTGAEAIADVISGTNDSAEVNTITESLTTPLKNGEAVSRRLHEGANISQTGTEATDGKSGGSSQQRGLAELEAETLTTPLSSHSSSYSSLDGRAEVIPTEGGPTSNRSGSSAISTQQSRVTELEAEILHQARMMIVLYTAVGILLVCTLLFATRYLIMRFSKSSHLLGQQPPQRQPYQQSNSAYPTSVALQMNGKEAIVS